MRHAGCSVIVTRIDGKSLDVTASFDALITHKVELVLEKAKISIIL